MRQPIAKVDRLLDAAAERKKLVLMLQISPVEMGVMRALAGAFGKPLPPLKFDEEEEADVREGYVMRMVQANQ